MTIKIEKRAFIRIISFSLAILVVTFGYLGLVMNQSRDYKLKVEYSYLRAIDDLAEYMNGITSTLNKSMYVGTPELLSVLSSNLWRESSSAKTSLSSLPIGTLNLGETYKFLSQVGDYSLNVSKKVSEGKMLQEEETNNLKSLMEFSKKLNQHIMVLQDSIRTGSINFEEVDAKKENEDIKAPSIGDGFEEFQQDFSSYPKLIYDGPFSDHILEKNPEKLIGLEEVSKEDALKKAGVVSNIDPQKLKQDSDEEGKMPSYCFSTDEINVSITKAGGLASYMVNSRDVAMADISNEQAKEKADEYLLNLKIFNVAQTYYEISNNVMTINYAHREDDIFYYTDLIKVQVALDNGEIVGFDSKGYIMNNKKRELEKPSITKEKAKESVNKSLNIEEESLAVIPTTNIQEVLAYQFLCTGPDGQKLLVYVNAYTGREEQVLMLLIDENGVLTI